MTSATLTGLVALGALVTAPLAARADDELDAGRVIAVEKRPYRMVHEFSAFAGVLPLDALYTGYSLGGSYTLHFSDLWAWEAIDFHYSADVRTGLDKTLGERWSVLPTKSPEIQYLASTYLVLKPLFGKFTLFNRKIVHAETYLALGGGIAHFDDGFRPQLSVGPGIRVFFSQRVSTRLDIRSTLSPDIPSGVDHVLQITLGVSFNFGAVQGADEAEAERGSGLEALDELFPGSAPTTSKPRATPSETAKDERSEGRRASQTDEERSSR